MKATCVFVFNFLKCIWLFKAFFSYILFTFNIAIDLTYHIPLHLMLVQVSTKAKPVRIGLVLGWETNAMSP